MFDRLLLTALAVFFILFGLLSVTNIAVDWSKPLMGFAALVAGVVCAVRAAR